MGIFLKPAPYQPRRSTTYDVVKNRKLLCLLLNCHPCRVRAGEGEGSATPERMDYLMHRE